MWLHDPPPRPVITRTCDGVECAQTRNMMFNITSPETEMATTHNYIVRAGKHSYPRATRRGALALARRLCGAGCDATYVIETTDFSHAIVIFRLLAGKVKSCSC